MNNQTDRLFMNQLMQVAESGRYGDDYRESGVNSKRCGRDYRNSVDSLNEDLGLQVLAHGHREVMVSMNLQLTAPEWKVVVRSRSSLESRGHNLTGRCASHWAPRPVGAG